MDLIIDELNLNYNEIYEYSIQKTWIKSKEFFGFDIHLLFNEMCERMINENK